MPWLRSGYCCRCGECCEGDPFPHDEDDPRRSPLMRQPPERQGYCPLLTFQSTEGPTACLGHTGMVPPGEEDPYYMSGCNVWPTDPGQIVDKPHCTYTFKWV